ncbi:MAG: M48 family metalloprotease [bacterium]|nr:M48 family metalloprotease [bacterium]
MFRRIVPLVVILSLVGAICPTPARATSTQTEIEMGRASDEQIVETNVIETDPLLNAYVQKIANNLWREVARKDVPYNIKIIQDTDVNSFATLGGYVYINEGLIDFVQSDDELAGVIGHETGHIERRHVLTMQSKAQALNLLFGVAAIFSPLIYQFGNLMEAGAMAKISRADELQADRTGLQLMARAGYDPENMETMLAHLNALGNAHADVVTKYLQDHPDPGARVNHLLGYPELDPKDVTEQQLLVQALGDRERARYEFSEIKFEDILKKDPSNAEALLGLGQDQLALGFPNKSQQTLAEAAQIGSAQTRDLANARIAALRDMEVQRVDLTQPNLGQLRGLLADAQTAQDQANTAIDARRSEGLDQLKQINARLNALQYETQQYGAINPPHGSRLEAILKNLNTMSRSINSALADSSESIGGVGSLRQNKESGLLRESRDILKEMQAPLDATPIPSDSLAVLPSYPSMFAELRAADSDMIRSVDGARAALTILDQSVGDLDAFFRLFNNEHLNFQGDISQSQYDELAPQVQKLATAFNNAATAASEAAQLYNMARTRQLSTRITLLGLGSSPQRYSTLQYALKARFGLDGVPYAEMLHDGLTPGDVTVGTILAADIKSDPEEILDEAVRTKKSPVDIANEHGMHAWPLEIFTGLIYLDYTDDPQKELQTT